MPQSPGEKEIHRRSAALAIALGLLIASPLLAADTPDDPYIWLEDAHGAKAMDWVNAENAKTLPVLEKDSRYPGLYADALAIAEAKDRIPLPSTLDGAVFNFWQDADHVRGIWRRTDMEGYAAPETEVDHRPGLGRAGKGGQGANWFLKNIDASEPDEKRVMLSLSDGGEDAATIREFDIPSAKFVTDGFVLPKEKQRTAWEDAGATILVSRGEWNPGELTTSGYPFIVKRPHCGQALADGKEIYRGKLPPTAATAFLHRSDRRGGPSRGS